MTSAPPGLSGSVRAAVAAVLGCALLVASLPVDAGVTTSTEIRAYRVSGTNAGSLVSYMRNNPFPGDKGAAVANIRPNYSLAIATRDDGSVCRASAINLDIHFVITLPQAVNAASLSGDTRSAWTNFVAFARRHEETHRSIYVQCANEFAAKALRLTAQSCFALEANIRAMLQAEKQACDTRQNAFDRAQYRQVFGLSLFSMAKYAGRKPIAVSTGGGT